MPTCKRNEIRQTAWKMIQLLAWHTILVGHLIKLLHFFELPIKISFGQSLIISIVVLTKPSFHFCHVTLCSYRGRQLESIVMGGMGRGWGGWAMFKPRGRVGSNAASHPMTWGHKGRRPHQSSLSIERTCFGPPPPLPIQRGTQHILEGRWKPCIQLRLPVKMGGKHYTDDISWISLRLVFWVFPCLLDSAWINANLPEAVGLDCETPKSIQPNPPPHAEGTPCTVVPFSRWRRPRCPFTAAAADEGGNDGRAGRRRRCTIMVAIWLYPDF